MSGSITRRGGLSYLHLPARSVEESRTSARFYAAVLGWSIRDEDGNPQFEDGTGDVAGAWVTHRSPSPNAGMLIYVYVDDVAATLDLVSQHGGSVSTPVFPEGDLFVATFLDPGSNEMGLWQQQAAADRPR